MIHSRTRFNRGKRANAGEIPANTVAPVISGTPQVDETLSVTNGTWTNSPLSYAYQWKRDGVAIGSATSSTYLLTVDDALTQITCMVTATNAAGSASANSNALDIEDAPPSVLPITEIPGLVAFWDGKVYSGSGNWLNQADTGAAYDVTPTDTSLHNGENLWDMNNIAYFTGTNTAFMKALHKTTGGQSFTFFGKFKPPASSVAMDSIFGTASTSGNHGIEIRSDSSGIPKIDQYAGGSAVTKQSTMVTNRAFSSGSTGWTITGSGLTIPGVTTADWAASNGVLSQTLPVTLIEGTVYRTTYTVSNFVGGTITVSLGGTAGTPRSANGTYTEDIVCGATSVFAFTGANFTGSIDNTDVRFAQNEYYNIIITRNASTNQLGFACGTLSLETIADGWGASSTDATYDYNLASDGNNANVMDSGAYILGMGFIDHALTQEEVTTLIASLDAHFDPPVAVVPSQAVKILAMAGDTTVYFNFDVATDGGSPLTDTLIETSADGSTGWSAVSDSAWGAARDIQVNGLTNGVSAYYRLTTINAVGAAASPSAVIGPLTPVAPGTAPYDLDYYKITAPVNSDGLRSGNAREITQPALLTHNSAFFGREDGKFYYQAPDGGAATATASSCRSELRHLTNVAYDVGSEDTLKFSIECSDNGAGSYPGGHKMVCHQIHDANEPWVKIVYTSPSTEGGSNGQIRALVKATAGASDTVTVLKTGVSDGDITTLRIKYVVSSKVGDLVTGTLQFFLDANVNGSTPDFTSSISRNEAGLTYYWKRGIYPTPSSQLGYLYRATHYTQEGQYIPFDPYAVSGMTFGFEARNQGVADAATTSTITDESSGGRNLTGESSTTFTYDEATNSFYKTTNKTCFSNLTTSGFYGTAGTVIVMGQLISSTGALCSLVSASANVSMNSDAILAYNVNQAGGVPVAAGTYDLNDPFMMSLRITDASNAKIRVNDLADTSFDPNNAYNTNTFFRIGSINGTTAGALARYYGVFTFNRALTDEEIEDFYRYFRENFY